MKREELDRLTKLEAKATPGPWGVYLPEHVHVSAPMRWLRAPRHDDTDAVSIGSQRLSADAEFVATFRNAAPALLAAAHGAEKHEAELARLHAELERVSAERDAALTRIADYERPQSPPTSVGKEVSDGF